MSEIYLDEKTITHKIRADLNANQLLVDKHTLGSTDDEKLNYNLYTLARKNTNVKNLVIELCNHGFVIVSHKNGISRFVRITNGNDLLPYMKGYEYTELAAHGRMIYSLESPATMSAKRMLVVFSSVADNPYATNLAKRNFFKNFSSISKYMPPDTCILRLSDIGGVVGSFYLNNNYDSNIEAATQEVILKVSSMLGISKENIVFYGVSKGGTGSLYHGVMGGYKVVAVDPIVADDHHEQTHNDSHFTIGTFPKRKLEKFTELLNTSEVTNAPCIITSSGSPIFKYINELSKVTALYERASIYDYQHKHITDHPKVGPNSVNLLTTLLNGQFYGLIKKQSKILQHGP